MSVRGTDSPITFFNLHPWVSSQQRIPCYHEDCEDLSHFSRDNNIREAVVTSSQAKGRMKGTTSGANDALADLPKLLQEGGTDSCLQCGSRSSLSARVVEDRNSYVSGATWGLPSSFRDYKGKRSSSGPGPGTKVLEEAGEELLPAPDRPQHRQGQGEDQQHKLDDPGPGAVQDAREFLKT